MRSIILLTAVTGAIWYAGPQDRDAATELNSASTNEAQLIRWHVAGTGIEAPGCYLTMSHGDGAGPLVKTPACDGALFSQAERWWEDGHGNIVLASMSGERVAEFSSDETQGLVSVWPDHAILTLTPAR